MVKKDGQYSGKDREKKEKESFRSLEDLDCRKACTEVRRYISELVKKYPPEERFALVDDMKRAARSTTHNIAEGFGRFHFQENIQSILPTQPRLSIRTHRSTDHIAR